MDLNYNIIISDRVWLKLDKISDYYISTLERPDLAARLISKILNIIRSLKNAPETWQIYLEKDDETIRMAHYRRYNIFYLVDKPEQIIRVFDIQPPHLPPILR